MTVRRSLLWCGTILVLACDVAEKDMTAPGVSWELAAWRAATMDSVRYELDLVIPDELPDPIEGVQRITFLLADTTRPLVIDFAPSSDHVVGVRLHGDPVDYWMENGHILIPSHELRAGRNQVEVRFRAGEESLNRHTDYLYSLFVPDRARFAIPIFDQPNLKGRFSLTLTIPDHWKAVSNGPLAWTEAKGGQQRLEFAETKPISSYLFAFAAGEFQVESARRAGRIMNMFHRETDGDKVARNKKRIFDLHESALGWLEEYTGIPYPFDKFDFVLIPSFQYNGMEHPGAILYRSSSLFLDETATQSQLLGRASLIAHESAHMWFGDLVTMSWFDDVWTKEVFANFMAAKIVNPSFPELDHDLRFLLTHHPSAYEVDRTLGANPIRQDLANLVEAGTLYGAIIYEKAPIVMRQLEVLVGQESFREGMQEYLRAHSFGTATWNDLIEILDRRSELDLRRWSRSWVEEPGRPRVRVLPEYDREDRLQGIKLIQDDRWERGRIWPQRLQLALGYPDEVVTIPIDLSKATTTVQGVAGLPRPQYILPNAEGKGYAAFELDSESRQFLLDNLRSVENPLMRGSAWLTLWDEMLDGKVAPKTLFEAILENLAWENNALNVERVLSYTATTYWLFLTPEVRNSIAPELERLLWKRIETARDQPSKAAFFGSFVSTALTDDGIEALWDIWTTSRAVPGLPLSETDYTTLAHELAVRGVSEADELLEKQLSRIDNPDRRKRFEFIRPALSPDPEIRRAFHQSLKDPDNRRHEPWVLTALRYLHHPLRAEQSREYILPSLELLPEIQRTGDIFFPKRWLDAVLWGHNTPEAAQTVRTFLDEHPDLPPRLSGKVLQSADLLFRSAEIVY